MTSQDYYIPNPTKVNPKCQVQNLTPTYNNRDNYHLSKDLISFLFDTLNVTNTPSLTNFVSYLQSKIKIEKCQPRKVEQVDPIHVNQLF